MCKVIMIGCDLHDETLVLRIAEDLGEPRTLSLRNTQRQREKLVVDLKAQATAAGGARLLFAYEASGQGFGLYDQLTDAGIECHVLAPTGIARSQRQASEKNDPRDAQQLLELLRAHVFAGNKLPNVWVPDHTTRDDRELIRTRIDVAEKLAMVKTQIRCLLKRTRFVDEVSPRRDWSRAYRQWLAHDLCESSDSPLGPNAREALASLLRQLGFLDEEIRRLDREIMKLAYSERYDRAARRIRSLCGVGILTAMLFLTELGDLSRFGNRRQLAAYLGLTPRCFESGKANDRKGHITRQGSSRLRKVLCQAAWVRVRLDPAESEAYKTVVARNPKKKKIAIVALMRRLAIRMWHKGLEPDEPMPATPGPEAVAPGDKHSARARQKGPPRSASAVASASQGLRPRGAKAKATATAEGARG